MGYDAHTTRTTCVCKFVTNRRQAWHCKQHLSSLPSFRSRLSLSSQSSPFVWYWLYNFLCLWSDIWMKPYVALDLLCTNKLALQGPEGYTSGSCHHKFNIIGNWPRLAKFQEKAKNNTQTTANYVFLFWLEYNYFFFGDSEIWVWNYEYIYVNL